MGPKSWVMRGEEEAGEGEAGSGEGEGEGVPEVVEVRVRVAVRGPAVEGVNWMPSQQLVQVPVKVEVKAEVGGWPWP